IQSGLIWSVDIQTEGSVDSDDVGTAAVEHARLQKGGYAIDLYRHQPMKDQVRSPQEAWSLHLYGTRDVRCDQSFTHWNGSESGYAGIFEREACRRRERHIRCPARFIDVLHQ